MGGMARRAPIAEKGCERANRAGAPLSPSTQVCQGAPDPEKKGAGEDKYKRGGGAQDPGTAMEAVLIDRSGEKIRTFPLAPITRPSETIRICSVTLRSACSAVKVCLQCSRENVCQGCVCTSEAGGLLEEQRGVYFCGKCRHSVGPEKRGSVLVYSSTAEALEFYLRHKHVLSIQFIRSWIGGAAGIDRGAGGQRDGQRAGRSEREARRVGDIIGSAFAGPGRRGLEGAKKVEIDFGLLMRPAVEPRILPQVKYLPCQEDKKPWELQTQASGKHSNIDLQNRIKGLSQREILEIVREITPFSFIFLAKHKYGTYVIQLIVILATEEDLQGEIKALVHPHAPSLLKHEIGNYVVQHIMKFDVRFVVDCFLRDLVGILNSKIGARALKNCVKHFGGYKKELAGRIEQVRPSLLNQDSISITRSILKELWSTRQHGEDIAV